jgi:hypothetical protein
VAKKPLAEYLADDKLYCFSEVVDCMSTKAAEISAFGMIMLSSSDFSSAATGIPDRRNLFDVSLVIAPPSPELERPTNPGRFSYGTTISFGGLNFAG